MGNSMNAEEMFEFSYNIDKQEFNKYVIPMKNITPEMWKYINNFMTYGKKLDLQCFNFLLLESGNILELRKNGKPLPDLAVSEFNKLKNLIKFDKDCVKIDESNINNFNVVNSLTINILICFTRKGLAKEVYKKYFCDL